MLGENLGLAGVVLLLNRRDKKEILVLLLCESTDLRRGQDTYSEGGTHKETLCPQSKAEVGPRDEGTRSQLRQVADS